MRLLRRLLEALANGLLVACLAPPLAAVAFTLMSALSAGTPGEPAEPDWGNAPLLLLLGAATGAYLVGTLPAFVAGLLLPALRRHLSAALAATATGLVGTLVYAMTFGSHLFSGPETWIAIRTYALPAFIGVALAAGLALRIEARHTPA